MHCEINLKTFCENLCYLRKKHGLSKIKMARILGIGIRTLNLLEQDVASPRLGSSVLYNAGEYFNIKTDDLLHIPLK